MTNTAKKQVTETSKESHRKNILSGLYDTQNARVYKLIRKEEKPLTGRRVVELYRDQYSKFAENSSVRRAISSLLDLELIEVAFSDKCRKTNRKVSYYKIS